MKPQLLYAPKDQQLEGMRSVLEQFGFARFKTVLWRLQKAGYMSKAEAHRREKWARHLLGISYSGLQG